MGVASLGCLCHVKILQFEMNDLPVIRSYVMRKGFWDRQGANIASR